MKQPFYKQSSKYIPTWWIEVEPVIHDAVRDFASQLESKLITAKPSQLIKKKNPFLFRARVVENNANLLAKNIVDAFLSSSEETIFGNILEQIAVSICEKAKNGRKSSTTGIDLEYDENRIRTIMQIKSSVNWGNSSQRKKLVSDLQQAQRVLRQGTTQEVRLVEGCCYGPSRVKDLGTHFQIVGNEFWLDISGWEGTSSAVLSVIGQHAGNGLREVRETAQANIVNYLQEQSIATSNAEIQWKELLDYVMAKSKIK